MSELLRFGGVLPPPSGRPRFRGWDRCSAFPGTFREATNVLNLTYEQQRELSQTEFRAARIEVIRSQIDRGDYDSPDRMSVALARLLDLVG
jgi:hypothetical protein